MITIKNGNYTIICETANEAIQIMNGAQSTIEQNFGTTGTIQTKKGKVSNQKSRTQGVWTKEEVRVLLQHISNKSSLKNVISDSFLLKNHTSSAIVFVYYGLKKNKSSRVVKDFVQEILAEGKVAQPKSLLGTPLLS